MGGDLSGRTGGVAVLLISLLLCGCGGGSAGPASGSTDGGAIRSCQGSAALCGRRLDQIVFPATHNSYAASENPGWHFAPQRFDIGRQLDDGIRALLLDVHWGVPTGDGIVQTDLAAEGAEANKVAQALPPRALRVAERLAGPLGAGLPAGLPLPHSLRARGRPARARTAEDRLAPRIPSAHLPTTSPPRSS